MFGRNEQLAELKVIFKRQNQQNVIIYGRRRIGKSKLIISALTKSDVPYIYYQAKETSLADNLASLSNIIGEHFNLGKIVFPSFEEALSLIFTKAQENNLIFVFDEYPYLAKVFPGLDSVIQKLIDKHKYTSKLKLFLLGSYIDIMQNLTQPDKPLFGRIDHMMFVGALNYQEVSGFYSHISNEDKMMYYSVFGGVPYYNSLLNLDVSFVENIKSLIIRPSGALNIFIELLLAKELRKINNANIVLETIATGYKKFSDILGQNQTAFTSAQLANILNVLANMDLIMKTTPINDEENSKRTHYEINDNYIRFYYRYIYKNLSARSVMSEEAFYERYIANDFTTNFMPHVFENVLKDYLIIKNKQGAINPPFFKIGKYFYNDKDTKTNGEFDVVTLDDNGYIFYEAKYTKSKLDQKVVNEEMNQLEKLGLSYYKLGFASRNGFNVKRADDYVLITLDEMYSL